MDDNSKRPARPLAPNDSIRPATSTFPGPTLQEPRDPRAAKPKRSVVHVACLACRRLRIKCDGNRPRCMPCAKRNEACEYDVEANTTRSNALKRRNEELVDENTRLRELYSFLRQRPLVEAKEIFRRVRITDDPLEVHRHVVSADLLISQTRFRSSPSTTVASASTSQPDGDAQAENQAHSQADGELDDEMDDQATAQVEGEVDRDTDE